jgi:hypothetical protein
MLVTLFRVAEAAQQAILEMVVQAAQPAQVVAVQAEIVIRPQAVVMDSQVALVVV